VRAKPPPPVWNDGEHDHDLGEEHELDGPVSDCGERAHGSPGDDCSNHDDRNNEQRRDDDRCFEASLDAFRALIHAETFDTPAERPSLPS
jgi:hypothetical protein